MSQARSLDASRFVLCSALLCALPLVLGCGPEESGNNGSGSGGATHAGGNGSGGSVPSTGGSGTGGAGSGGRVQGTGGATSSTGGSTGTGGSASGGNGGGAGGVGTGGASSTGGASVGGAGGGSPFSPCPTTGDPCRVLPLGDSITYGLITVGADKVSSDSSIGGKDSHGGYRVKLFADAVAANQKMTFTGGVKNGPTTVSNVAFPQSHEGWSGFTIDSTTGNGITTKLDEGFKTIPHIVLLHIGTNDVYASSGQAGMGDRLTQLLDDLARRAPNALIVVANIIPLGSTYAALTTYNSKIPDVVAKQVAAGHHAVFLDMFTGFKSKTMLSGDAVHPNQTGYDYMGDTFYSAISGLLPK